MDLAIADLSAGKVSIDDVACDEQSFRQQFEVILDLDEPVNEGRADRLVYLVLSIHIQIVNSPFALLGNHVLEDISAEFTDMEHRVESVAIATGQLTEDLAVTPLVEHLLLLLKWYLLQLRLLLGGRLQRGQVLLVG